MGLKIQVPEPEKDILRKLAEVCDGDQLIARIFYNRGYKDLNTVKQMFHDEFYVPTDAYEFFGMSEAVERLLKAFSANEKICIYGDYDVDGVTSTVILMQYLSTFTKNLTYHVPDRFTEGYGMNTDVVMSLAKKGVSLIITCDCGIANIEEIRLARQLGIDVIVTDHHNIPDELPPANVILNPKMLNEGHKAYNLSGCGMAYFLCAALDKHVGGNTAVPLHLLEDMLALSLIADVVSLNGENRYLLKRGIKQFLNTTRLGLRALLNVVEKNCKIENEEDIAFQIAPRINAAGRMDNASLAVELFLAEDEQLAEDIAIKIDSLNSERKRIQQEITDQAIEIVENQKKNREILVLFNEYWHHGIIGIAAGKVCDMYQRPAILLSLKDDGETVVGSARSVEGIDIYNLLKRCNRWLKGFGGHAMAAGVSLNHSNLQQFVNELEEIALEEINIKKERYIDVDAEINLLKTINTTFLDRIKKAGPYGEGFRTPVFLTRQVAVISDRITSANHHILVLSDSENNRLSAVRWFGSAQSYQGKMLDIVYSVTLNSYRNSNEIQLNITEMAESSGIPTETFTGSIIDKRSLATQQLVELYPNAQFFYEGPKKRCNIDNTKTRRDIEKSDRLVFLSPPVNSEIFREVVVLSDPKEVILGFSIKPDYSFKNFIIDFMGVIKFIVNNQAGYTQLEYLASLMSVEQPIILSALKFFSYMGKISFEIYDYERLYISIVNNKASSKHVLYKKRLMDALAEKKAYSKFIENLDAERFVQYLT